MQQMFHTSMGSSWKIQQMVKGLQATDDETQQIDRHGMRANGLRLLVASLTGISSSTFREATQMLCDVCSYRPGIAVHLLSENNTDTLRNRFMGDKIQMELAYLNPEKLYAQMCLVGDLLSSLPTDDLLSVDQWLFKLYLQEYVQWQWRDDRRNGHNHSPADSFIVEITNQADDDGLQLDFMDRHYTIDFNINIVSRVQSWAAGSLREGWGGGIALRCAHADNDCVYRVIHSLVCRSLIHDGNNKHTKHKKTEYVVPLLTECAP